MGSEAMHRILPTLQDDVNSRPSAIEFEMAYQARVAIDRIRFAIHHTERFGPRTDEIRAVGLQLLDALQRLETVERRFQERSRTGAGLTTAQAKHAHAIANGCRKEVFS
jgi:hypothetical protein